jgi:hypothetical protein
LMGGKGPANVGFHVMANATPDRSVPSVSRRSIQIDRKRNRAVEFTSRVRGDAR